MTSVDEKGGLPNEETSDSAPSSSNDQALFRLFCDHPKFKNLEFKPGLNVLLAEKTPQATDKQTRNRAGKSSMVLILHFLLGSKCPKKSLFKTRELEPYTFGLDLMVGEDRVTVQRSGKAPTRMLVEGETESWPISPKKDKKTGLRFVGYTDWLRILGVTFFNRSLQEKKKVKKGPSFRSMFPYFARMEADGGFAQPHMHFRQQITGDWQMGLTYLLGLDWSLTERWQGVRNREKTLKELKKASKDGTFGAVIGKAADLRTELTIAETKADRLKKNIESFTVHDQYHELENEASELTAKIGRLSDENTVDRQYLKQLEGAAVQEAPPALDTLERLYQEVNVVLPKTATRRYEEVRAFHESVVQNRVSYLEAEINDSRRRITARDIEKASLDKRRAQVMGILRSHGALDHFNQLQAELNQEEAELATLRERYKSAEALERQKTKLKVERGRLLERLRQDYQEQEDQLRRAIVAFEDISSALYETAGHLTIEPTDNGPLFEVRIEGKRSAGISRMQVFSFDMMLMQLCRERDMGPRFLVHDSHLFDGVDERQIAKALQVGAELADRLGFQYLVTMNTDDVPQSFPAGFDLDPHVLPVRLTDATEDGGLFGFRFQ